jgi:hypothetical protein
MGPRGQQSSLRLLGRPRNVRQEGTPNLSKYEEHLHVIIAQGLCSR